uniref:Uncharacterized protein n=1 Tax=Triticum urartu TaxID=4572 RepID=A0A8R7QJD1_TRIUA
PQRAHAEVRVEVHWWRRHGRPVRRLRPQRRRHALPAVGRPRQDLELPHGVKAEKPVHVAAGVAGPGAVEQRHELRGGGLRRGGPGHAAAHAHAEAEGRRGADAHAEHGLAGGGLRLGDGRRHGARLAAAAADGDVAERAALGPVAAARLAEVARLGEVVVVVVAELGVGGVAPGATQRRLLRPRRPLLRLPLPLRRRRGRGRPLRGGARGGGGGRGGRVGGDGLQHHGERAVVVRGVAGALELLLLHGRASEEFLDHGGGGQASEHSSSKKRLLGAEEGRASKGGVVASRSFVDQIMGWGG